MNIVEMRQKRDDLAEALNELVSKDSFSKSKEQEFRSEIKAISKPLAIAETQAIIQELELKQSRGVKINEEKLQANKDKLAILTD